MGLPQVRTPSMSFPKGADLGVLKGGANGLAKGLVPTVLASLH